MNISEIKTRAFGQWRFVHMALAPQLSDKILRGKRHGPCPLCGGKDRARCHNDYDETGGMYCNQCGGGADGIAVLQWANQWTWQETLKRLSEYFCKYGDMLARSAKSTESNKVDWELKRRDLKTILDDCIEDTGRIASYFESRRLYGQVPHSLRLHPNLPYFPNGEEPSYPAMVACIQRDGELIGIHQTWLDRNGPGKASESPSKKSRKCCQSMTGGAIHLFPHEQGKPLVLAEGIETGMAVHQLTGWPVWSCISAPMLGKVITPEYVQKIYIACDKDRSEAGQESAQILADRLIQDGKEVYISIPPSDIPEGSKSVDWLDQLNIEKQMGTNYELVR